MKQLYEIGDKVVINCDERIIYTIVSIYGDGRSAMCTYIDTKTNTLQELSIPIIALTKSVSASVSDENKKAIVKKDVSPGRFISFYI